MVMWWFSLGFYFREMGVCLVNKIIINVMDGFLMLFMIGLYIIVSNKKFDM